MRDLIAGIAAVLLLLVAASLATRLTVYRRRREAARDSERARGRTVIAEIPAASDLVLFTEDASSFHFGDQAIDKAAIHSVRVLVNGSAIASYGSPRQGSEPASSSALIDDRPDGIARDRWDVAVEGETGTLLVECGAIRERVSQELARKVFDAVKTAIERRQRAVDPPPVSPA